MWRNTDLCAVMRLSATHVRVRLDSPLIPSLQASTAVRKFTLGAGPPTALLDRGGTCRGEHDFCPANRGGDFDARTRSHRDRCGQYGRS